MTAQARFKQIDVTRALKGVVAAGVPIARIAELEDQAASTLKAIDWLKTTLAQSAAQS